MGNRSPRRQSFPYSVLTEVVMTIYAAIVRQVTESLCHIPEHSVHSTSKQIGIELSFPYRHPYYIKPRGISLIRNSQNSCTIVTCFRNCFNVFLSRSLRPIWGFASAPPFRATVGTSPERPDCVLPSRLAPLSAFLLIRAAFALSGRTQALRPK